MIEAKKPRTAAAHKKALATFRQKDGSYKAKAMFRCLLARP